MNFFRTIPLAFSLVIAVGLIASVSYILGQPHDLTLVAIVISGSLWSVDWLITPRKRE